MSIFVIGSALLGVILARFFKFYVLGPTSIVVIILALMWRLHETQSLLGAIFSVAILVTSLQFGYFAGLFLTTSPQVRFRIKRSPSHLPSISSASSPSFGAQSIRHRRIRSFSRGQPSGEPFCSRAARDVKSVGPAS